MRSSASILKADALAHVVENVIRQTVATVARQGEKCGAVQRVLKADGLAHVFIRKSAEDSSRNCRMTGGDRKAVSRIV